MQNYALIVGSSPKAVTAKSLNGQNYYKIALNKAWPLRDDFDLHIGLQHKTEVARPPTELNLRTLPHKKIASALEHAGGKYFTSTGVAINAGYWAVTSNNFDAIVFVGCDLIYDRSRYGGKSHFYGVSDAGPLVAQNHPAQMNPEARMTRLFCWALLHRTILFNATYQEGTRLIFPKLDGDGSLIEEQRNAFLLSSEYREIMAASLKIFSYEIQFRPASFDKRWRSFKEDTEGPKHLDICVSKWQKLTEAMKEKNRGHYEGT